MTPHFVWLLSLSLLFSCARQEKPLNQADSYSTVSLKYARNFSIQTKDGAYILKVKAEGREWQSTQEIHCFTKDSSIQKDFISIETVPGKVVVISTTYLAYIESLDEILSITGIANSDLVYSSSIRKRIEEGKITDVGNDQALNYERIIELQADIILMYDFGSATSAVAKRLEKLGQRVIKIDEFRELTPLGKAEWIKFFGVLFDKYELADSIFNRIESNYLALLKLNESFDYRPTVFTGLPWKGQWYQPGGASFQATFFNDAGAEYLWSNDNHTSGITTDREVVFDRALKADFWVHPGNVLKREEIFKEDERYAHFESFKNNHVYNNNLRLNENMGNDYWESGLLNPHLVLKDLMAIFHPEFFPEHEFYYYRKVP